MGNLIHPEKSVDTIVKAFDIYKQKRLKAQLLVLGDGAERSYLESLSKDGVHFLGSVDNVIEYLQISDVFVSAALSEGLPNTVLEAMACGLQTILSNINPHKELAEIR